MLSGTTLITGTSGFIGKRFKQALVDAAYSNIITLNEDDVFKSNNWHVNLQSFLNVHKPSEIFHFGASSDTLKNDVQFMMERNFETTSIIASWCKNNNAKLIYSSSAACYGIDDMVPSNLYGWSKYCAERVVSALGGISLRYFNVYGPGEEHKGRMASVFYQAYLQNLDGHIFNLFPGFPKRDFIFVDDVITANLIAMRSFASCSGLVFDVGTATPRTFEDGLKIMQISYKYLPAELIPDGYQIYTAASKSRWVPGWQPAHNLESGLSAYMNYLGVA